MTTQEPNQILLQWRDSAPYWEKHSATICAMFSPLTEALIQDAGIQKGQSVLDVAAGPGEPSLTIAEVVGPSGSVTCTDAVGEMVRAAEAEAHRRGLTNMRFRQCTAESLPFANNTFDRVVSRLGAMFFPGEAFTEILRVTRPGGRVSFVVWDKGELNPFFYSVMDVVSRYVETPPVDPDAPGAFRFAERGKLAALLREAGAIEINERVLACDIAAPISRDQFWEVRSGLSETLRAKLAALSESQRVKIAREVKEAVREFFPSNHMKFPAKMIVVTGTKPN